MNRSTVREFLAPGTRVAPGEVLVPTEVGDPVRGPLPCPAAPLVGGTLLRKGTRVGYAPVGHCADPSHEDGGAALFVATCPQRDGSQAAVAAAASAADHVAMAAARSAVDEWSAVLGTRRLLTAASPWCSGATQALAAARPAPGGRGTRPGPRPLAAALRSRFPAVHGPRPDGFCYAASDRAETVRVIASASDVMLVLGCADSPDSRQLSGLARDRGARTHVVGETGDILPAMLAGTHTIGIAESTSASPDLAGQVTKALSGLGRLSVITRHVRTDVIGAPAWRP